MLQSLRNQVNCSFTPYYVLGFPGSASGKESVCHCRRLKRHRFDPWVRKIPWRRSWLSSPIFLPGEFPWTGEPGGLQSKGLQRVRHDWSNLARTHICKDSDPTESWILFSLCLVEHLLHSDNSKKLHTWEMRLKNRERGRKWKRKGISVKILVASEAISQHKNQEETNFLKY